VLPESELHAIAPLVPTCPAYAEFLHSLGAWEPGLAQIGRIQQGQTCSFSQKNPVNPALNPVHPVYSFFRDYSADLKMDLMTLWHPGSAWAPTTGKLCFPNRWKISLSPSTGLGSRASKTCGPRRSLGPRRSSFSQKNPVNPASNPVHPVYSFFQPKAQKGSIRISNSA